MGGAERVGQRITSEVRWDQSHLIPLSSNQAPKSYFAKIIHGNGDTIRIGQEIQYTGFLYGKLLIFAQISC